MLGKKVDLRSLVSHYPGMMFKAELQDGQYIYTLFGGESLEQMGYASDHIVGKGMFEFLPESVAQKLVPYYDAAWRGEAVSYLCPIENRVFQTFLRPVVQDGVTVELIGYCIDITQQKKAEAELATTKHYLESFIEHTPDAISIRPIDSDILFVNKAFERLFEITFEEYQQNWKIIFPNEEIYQESLTKHLKVLTEGKPVEYETYRKRKDGSLLNVEITYSPIRRVNGEIIGTAGIVRDISDRKRYEAAVRESEAKYRIVAENTSDVISIIDINGTFIYISPSVEANLGFSPEEYIGFTINDLLHPDDWPLVLGGFQELLDGKQSLLVEKRIKHKQGHYVHFESRSVPVFNKNGEIENIVSVTRNITERKLAEEIIRKTEKLSVIGELAAGIAHEIRNPLTSLKGFIQLLHTNSLENKHYYQIMEAELDRINYIVSELLVLSKPQVLHYKDKNINEIIDSVITLLETQAIINNVQIKTESHPSLAAVRCEENQIKQVFINLLKNAIEASPHGAQILIQTDMLADEQVLIRFIDNGGGIPAELITKLGEPFYTTKEKGTGLGLMVSNKIIKDHNGSISISSHLGEGTTVDVILPVKQTVY